MTDHDQAGTAESESVTMPRSDAQLLDRVRRKVVEIGILGDNECDARAAHKLAKHELDDARLHLERMIRGDAEPTPLLDYGEGDGWKRVPMNVAIGEDLASKIQKGAGHILKAGTLGEFAEFNSNHRLTDIKGLGPKAADDIEEALERFWSNNPQWTEAVEA